jgi:hypothetical protein
LSDVLGLFHQQLRDYFPFLPFFDNFLPLYWYRPVLLPVLYIFIRPTFTIRHCILRPILLWWSKQGGWDGWGMWRAWGRWGVHTTFWLGGLKGGDH